MDRGSAESKRRLDAVGAEPRFQATVTAAEDGTVSTSMDIVEDDLGKTFEMIATEQVTLRTAAVWVFTDSRNWVLTFAGTGSGSVTITPSTGTVEAPTSCGGTGVPAASQTVSSTCTPNITTSENGTSVQFAASAGSGSNFSGWSGQANLSSSTCSGTTTPCSAVIGANAALTVTFNADATTSVTIDTSPSGLQVIVDGTTYAAPSTFNWTPGSSHTLNTPSPQSGSPGQRFVWSSWSHGGTQSQTITAPSSTTTYTANFTTQYLLTLSITAGVPGGVGTNISGGTTGTYYDAGTILSLTAASPVAGGSPGLVYTFKNWTGDVTSPPNTSNPVSVTMSAPRSVTANYTTISLQWVTTVFAGQYSDKTGLQASLTIDGSAAPSKGIDFAVGTETGSAVTNASGIATDLTPLTQPAGSYTASATCPVASCGVAVTITHSFTINKEDAALTYDSTNPSAVPVASPGGNSGPITLKVTVQERNGPEPSPSDTSLQAAGDITKAGVSITLSPVGPGSSIGPVACTAGSSSVATYPVLPYTCDFNNVPVNTYEVTVQVTGNYYTAPDYSDVLTVYDPSLGFTTGGGFFYWPGTGEKTNFGFNMKYNKKGTNPQGSVLVIKHLPDGNIVRMKSNSVTGLSLGDVPTTPMGWASISGKATFIDTRTMSQNEGNQNFIVYVEDRNEPGTGIDKFWVQVSGVVPQTVELSLPSTAAANAVTISGGNIVVPHTNSSTSGGGKK